MSNSSNSQNEKKERANEIKEAIHLFCEKYLNEELENYSFKLCDTLSRKRKIDILRGKTEIWAASIIYVIARLNFLFDKENENQITVDIICDFFNTNKSTTGNKATQIEKACNLNIGAEGYCNQEITDALTYYKTPEGFLIPKSMIADREIIIEFVDGKEAEEIQKYAEHQRNMIKQKEMEKKQRRAEINREIAKKKKEKKVDDKQLGLFGD